MPPNRKNNADVVNNIASINVNSLQAKFLPLTHPQEAEQRQQRLTQCTEEESKTTTEDNSNEVIHAPHTQDAFHPANSYWDWPSEPERKQDVIDRILQEEKIRQLLSGTHLAESAILAQKTNSTTEDVIRSKNNNIVDDYWVMPSEESGNMQKTSYRVNSNRTAQASYWDWPTHTEQEERDLTIQSILKHEARRQLLSIDHIEKNLTKQAELLALVAPSPNIDPENDAYWDWNDPQTPHVSDPEYPMTGYWDWPSSTDTQHQQKAKIIQKILEEERIRQVMSVEHLESKLVSRGEHHAPHQAPLGAHTGGGGGSDSYWDW